MSSPRLFVDSGQPPAAQQSSSTYQAQPAGPGFPSAEPSAAAMIVMPATLPGARDGYFPGDRTTGGPNLAPRAQHVQIRDKRRNRTSRRCEKPHYSNSRLRAVRRSRTVCPVLGHP